MTTAASKALHKLISLARGYTKKFSLSIRLALVPFTRLSLRQEINRVEERSIKVISEALGPMIQDGPKRMMFLDVMQKHGFHAVPNRYWEPVPLVSDIDRITRTPTLIMDDIHGSGIEIEIEKLISSPAHVADFREFFEPIENNSMFPGLDAFVYREFIRKYNPKKIVEIGAGYSTFIASKASKDLESITCIEPYPSEFLRSLVESNKSRITLIESPAQGCNTWDIFTSLQANDILFIDSSHACFTGSDVSYIFLSILPKINPGVLVHFHDVSLPYEYPRSLIFDSGRMYNEQYMVANLLTNGRYSFAFGSYQFLLRRGLWLNNSKASFDRGLSFWLMKQ